MDKYTKYVTEINPMETAPLWDYYNGDVEVVTLFYINDFYGVSSVSGYFNRDSMCWREHYSDYEIFEELIGWLPYTQYVSTN